MANAEHAQQGQPQPAADQGQVRSADQHAIAKEVLAELQTPRFHRWLFGLLSDWGVVVLALILARQLDHVVAYALAVFLIGTRQHAMGILGHDGGHRLATRTRWLNDVFTQVFCFWPLCAEMNAYRQFHFTHHRYLNMPQDPEMAYRRLGAPAWDVPCSPQGIGLRFLKDVLGLGAFESLRVLYAIRPHTWRGFVGPASLLLVATLVTTLTGTVWVLVLWFAALFTSFAAVWRFRCWLEHLGTDDTHRVSMPQWLAWVIAPHNVWAHWEHHKWPAIPYWNLSRVRQLDASIPIMTVWELLQYYDQCQPVQSGAPTKDAAGYLPAHLS